MNLFYFSESPFPSTAANTVQVMNMCSAFAELGHDVTLVCRRPDATERSAAGSTRAVFEAYDLPEQFRIIRYPFTQPPGRKTRWTLRAALRARVGGCGLAYGRSPRACLFAARLGLPVVYESHKLLDKGNAPEYRAARQLLVHRNLRRVVVLSHALARKFVSEYGVDVSRVRVAYNAARDPGDPRPLALEPGDRPAGGHKPFRVGYAGSLHEGKGMELIAALAPLVPRAQFYVAGGNDTEVARWRERTGDEENISLLGALPQKDLPAFRAAMDVLLVPPKASVRVAGGGRIEQADAPPLKLFEALASGKPVICSDFLGEVVTDGEHALLRDPEEPGQWARALEYLISDEAARERLSRGARELFLSEYTWRRRAEKVLAGLA